LGGDSIIRYLIKPFHNLRRKSAMTEENSLKCPNCGKKTILKSRVYYGVFGDLKQPDGVCGNCGAFYWKHPQKPIPSIVFKSAEQKEEQKPKKWDWFKVFVEQDGKRIRR